MRQRLLCVKALPPTRKNQEDELGCWALYLRGGSLTPEQKVAIASRKKVKNGAPSVIQFHLHPESIRQLRIVLEHVHASHYPDQDDRHT